MALLAPLLVIGVLAAGGLSVVVLRKAPLGDSPAVQLGQIADQEVKELESLVLDIPAAASAGKQQSLVCWMVDGPQGASIDPSGRFIWRPSEAQGPGEYWVVVGAALGEDRKSGAQLRFKVSVSEVLQPPTVNVVPDQEARPGEPLILEISAADPDQPAALLRYRLGDGAPAGATIDPDTGRFAWTPSELQGGRIHEIVVEVAKKGERGAASEVAWKVKVASPARPELVDRPVVGGEKPVEKRPEQRPAEAAPAPAPADQGNEVILGLYEKRRLFHPAEYTTLRKIAADRFAAAHAEAIRAAWGDDEPAMTKWLDEHVHIREEFYTAIDPELDDPPSALGLFHEMWKLSPERLAEYGNLAIAVAVTWDRKQDVYDYAGHQRRTRSTMPEGLLGALDNYTYVVQSEKIMQGRGQYLPWEFLVHVVNHKTPLAERQWAVQHFLPERVMIGKCYGKVPYDGEMLASGGEIVKLAGQSYTLANLVVYGGVCAMQADFASRVAKSLGVPAAYVGGESRFGELHAWVMWVELKEVGKSGIRFGLESHGRYRGDHYYVGNLKDPKTGKKITDRQLELRLHTIGANPLAKRQADLIMDSFPMLRDHYQMEIGDQLAFLDQLLRLCPWNEAAWRAVARMSREGQVPKTHVKMMTGIVGSLFTTFAAFPDFTWEVFDDLIAFQDLPKKRAQLYGQLVELYERAGRPDLSCQARLRYTDYLVGQGQENEAIGGLAASILRFPDEGRYVPVMLDRLDELCDKVETAGPDLVRFYAQFLQQIPVKRGSRPSKYCMEMYERAIGRFRKYGQEPMAQQYELKLAALKDPEVAGPPGTQ